MKGFKIVLPKLKPRRPKVTKVNTVMKDKSKYSRKKKHKEKV